MTHSHLISYTLVKLNLLLGVIKISGCDNCPLQCPHAHTYTYALHPNNCSVGTPCWRSYSQDKMGKPDISTSILNACEEHSRKITQRLHHRPAQKAMCELK